MVLALGVTLVRWAGAFVAIRAAVPDSGVAGLVAGPLLVVSVGLAAIAAVIGVRRPARADPPLILGSGLIGQRVHQTLLNAGDRGVHAGTPACWTAPARSPRRSSPG